MNTKIEAIKATATIAPTSPNVPRDGPVDSTVDAAVKLVLGVVVITMLVELVVVEEVPDVMKVVEAGKVS
jgi:hypothetical protein